MELWSHQKEIRSPFPGKLLINALPVLKSEAKSEKTQREGERKWLDTKTTE